MTSESATSPAIPPPQQDQHSEHQPLPQNQVNSDPISAVTPSQPQAPIANSNGVAVSDQASDEIEEPSYFKFLDSKEQADKYRRYESEFKQLLLAKYFSGKDPNGVNIYEERTTIDGETIMSSKWPCTRFYADPDISFPESVQCLDQEQEDEKKKKEQEDEEEESVDSASEETTPGRISNGGIVTEKKSS